MSDRRVYVVAQAGRAGGGGWADMCESALHIFQPHAGVGLANGNVARRHQRRYLSRCVCFEATIEVVNGA